MCVRAAATGVRTLRGCPSLPGAHVARTPGSLDPQLQSAPPRQSRTLAPGGPPPLVPHSAALGIAGRPAGRGLSPRAAGHGRARAQTRPELATCSSVSVSLPCSTPSRAASVPSGGPACPAAGLCAPATSPAVPVLHPNPFLGGGDAGALRGAAPRPEDGGRPRPCRPCSDPHEPKPRARARFPSPCLVRPPGSTRRAALRSVGGAPGLHPACLLCGLSGAVFRPSGFIPAHARTARHMVFTPGPPMESRQGPAGIPTVSLPDRGLCG